MNWKFWNRDKERKKKEEKEYLDYLNRKVKEGVNPTYKPPPPPPTTVTGLTCPNCGSNQIGRAGYGDRFECKKCGKVFG